MTIIVGKSSKIKVSNGTRWVSLRDKTESTHAAGRENVPLERLATGLSNNLLAFSPALLGSIDYDLFLLHQYPSSQPEQLLLALVYIEPGPNQQFHLGGVPQSPSVHGIRPDTRNDNWDLFIFSYSRHW